MSKVFLDIDPIEIQFTFFKSNDEIFMPNDNAAF